MRRVSLVMTTIGLSLGPFLGVSPGQGRDGLSIPELLQSRPDIRREAPRVSTSAVPMDSPVEPAEYVVGPGDIIALNIWSSAPVENQLAVTPEGTLLIPSIGGVDVRDMALAEVKRKVGEQVQKRYPNASITVTLISPRQVVVKIAGNVLNEESFEVRSVQRVDYLIALANSIQQGQPVPRDYQSQLASVQYSGSRRHIILRRRSGSVHRVDLSMYHVTKEGRFNPYLQEGDLIYVPWRDGVKNSIGIYGGVVQSGSHEFVDGDKASDLIKLGYGLSQYADSQHVRLYRLSSDGSQMDSMILDAKALIEGNTQDIFLQTGDRIFVPKRDDPRQSYTVMVEGEVIQEGHYPITRNTTTLSDVIRVAGGFTKDANIVGSVLLRGGVSTFQEPEEIEHEHLLSLRASVSAQDSGYFLTETALRLKGEMVSVDFRKLFVLGDSSHDVVLNHADRILVPRKRRTVYVYGQVLAPGHVPLIEGEDYKHYVRKAGGFTNEARSGDVKIIKGSSRAWLDPDETNIEDGDFIWVPKEQYHPFSYYMTTYTQIASIIGVAATVALLINTIK